MSGTVHAMQFGTKDLKRAQVANPYLFIVGCPRSGTTLLQRMMNAHPQITVTPESHWIPRLIEKPWAATAEGTVTRKLVRRLTTHPKFARLCISREQVHKLAKRQAVSYSCLVTRILDLYATAQGKPLVGDKTPDYVRSIDLLHNLWPNARFVHLIRDGRDVCLSMLEWPKVHPRPGNFVTWKEDPVSTAAWWWQHNVQIGRQAGKSLGCELYYELRYESLVTCPREQCEALSDFLNLPFDEAILQFHAGRPESDPGLEKKRAGLPITSGLRNWQYEMPAQDVERFEAIAGELLGELRYPRAFPQPRTAAVEHAARIRDLLNLDPRVQN